MEGIDVDGGVGPESFGKEVGVSVRDLILFFQVLSGRIFPVVGEEVGRREGGADIVK